MALPWHDWPRSAWPSGTPPSPACPPPGSVFRRLVGFLWKNHAFTSFYSFPFVKMQKSAFAQRGWLKGSYWCVQSQPSFYSSGFWKSSQEKTNVLPYKSHSNLTWQSNEVFGLYWLVLGFKSDTDCLENLSRWIFGFVLGFPNIFCLCLGAVMSFLKMTKHGLSSLLTIHSVDPSSVLVGNCSQPKRETFRYKMVQTHANSVITVHNIWWDYSCHSRLCHTTYFSHRTFKGILYLEEQGVSHCIQITTERL